MVVVETAGNVGGGGGGGGGNQAGEASLAGLLPTEIQVTPQDKEAIERVTTHTHPSQTYIIYGSVSKLVKHFCLKKLFKSNFQPAFMD